MALLTLERSQSFEGILSSSSDESSSVCDESTQSSTNLGEKEIERRNTGVDHTRVVQIKLDDQQEIDCQIGDVTDSPESKFPKLGRMRSPSFAGYFASKGGAVSLPDGKMARTPTLPHGKTCGELQFHLQTMLTLLREEDSLKMAVRIESQLPDKKRYLTAVTNSKDECILIGIDWANGPTIGVVLELHSSTVTKLDGDGGFHVSYETEITHCFKPVSVQTLWSAMHIIQRGIDTAKKNGHTRSYQDFVAFYKSKITSDPTSISEWNMMDDLLSTRQFDMVLSEQEESEILAVKKLIRAKLKEIDLVLSALTQIRTAPWKSFMDSPLLVMVKVDLDEITSRQIRVMCEDELGMDLSEFKSFLDTEMFTILGQMDSASKIFEYLYLGSEWNASDLEELQNVGIGYILNLTREIDNFFPETFQYFNIRVYDEEDTELLQYWDRTYKFIHNAKMNRSKVLVHCRRGISRSASSVIAYVMKSRGWSLKESMEYVKSCRSIIEPNAGFQKQLIIYEGILNSSRNRYSALFRQRSKSDVESPSTRDRRRMFKKSKLSREIDEEVYENTDGGDTKEMKNPKRPKSWAPDSSKEIFTEPESAHIISSREPELPPLNENLEESSAAQSPVGAQLHERAIKDIREEEHNLTSQISKRGNEEVPGNDSDAKNVKVEKRPRRHALSRAKTLPSQMITHWEEFKGANGQKGNLFDGETVLTPAEEAKEEDLLEQAVAASVMKRKLLRSLEQLQGLRQTKELLDNQFSVESIIRPSSLRKASFSRKLPFERTKSFSEEADTSSRHHLRERSFTVAHTKYFGSENVDSHDDDDDVMEGGRLTQGDKLDAEKELVKPHSELKESCIDTLRTEVNEKECLETSDEIAKHVTVKSKQDANDGQVAENDNVIETSQFRTVKESKKLIEEQEKLRAQRIRILRCPRRHTIGESKIWNEIINENSSNVQLRSKSSEGRAMKRDQSPSPETWHTNPSIDLQTITTDSLNERETSQTSLPACRLQKHNSFSEGFIPSLKVSSKQAYDSATESLEDLSVKKLVQRHTALIRNSSPPGNSESSGSFFDTALSSTSIGESVVSNALSTVSQSEASLNSFVASDREKIPVKEDMNVVQPGLVKRQSKIFLKSKSDDLDATPASDHYDTEEHPNAKQESEGKWVEVPKVEDISGLSKRNSVKKRLQQLEKRQGRVNERPVSLNLEKGERDLDTEVAYFMQEDETDSTTVALRKAPPSLLFPDVIGQAKSAPASPKPPAHSQPRADLQRYDGRSCSMDDMAELRDIARCSRDVFLNVSPGETPDEDVKSLVDKFEGGSLVPLE